MGFKKEIVFRLEFIINLSVKHSIMDDLHTYRSILSKLHGLAISYYVDETVNNATSIHVHSSQSPIEVFE